MHDMLNILVLRLDCTEAKTTIKKQKKKRKIILKITFSITHRHAVMYKLRFG